MAINAYLLDIAFPYLCVGCRQEQKEEWLCYDCKSLIEIFDRQYCPFCSTPKEVHDGRTCPQCRRSKKLSGLFCAASFENKLLKTAIHQFKYEPYLAKCLAKDLASLIITHFNLLNKNSPTDWLLTPVPLHRKRLKWRGFNQAAEIARELSENMGAELVENALAKIRVTPPQTELSEGMRQENVVGAFVCLEPKRVKERKILLVDDVFTTGATMEECARILKQAGAKEVWGVVVARG